MTTNRCLTPAEAADLLSVPTRTLARWRWIGQGPKFLKIGKHVRYRQKTLDEWLVAREVANTSQSPS